MTRFNPLKAIAFTLALAGIGLTAPDADAGSRDKSHHRSSDHYQREYNRGHHRGNHYDHNRHNRHYRSSSEQRYWRNHDRHSNDGLSFSIRLGSSDHHSRTSVSYHHNRHHSSRHSGHYSGRHHSDRHHYSHPRSRTYSHSSHNTYPTRKVVVKSRGYWKREYVPAVYETRYYSCGTPYRVCTRASSYKRVWISGSYHH